MKNTTPSTEFCTVVKGHNFMTPYVIDYYEIKDGACELSTGKFLDVTLFGVTVVKNRKNRYDLSKCFDSENEAMEYIKTLQQ